ncbi:DUF4339 domain-containing protein [Edaphobacter aggregans]|uniref:DUF4339 domain-containing protein n=1 Tax=Edaphobacter aggregans TaxID=570835 RepID=UPI000555FA0C|nr:DUF4339 domain-containing protein [Edaphobacter aggregans]
MNYFISRDGQQYGPYTLADLQRYAASGEVSLTDLATSEGIDDPVPVAQIIGTIAVPAPPAQGIPAGEINVYPDPPNLHWGLVLAFTVLSCGIFTIVWEIVLAAWLKRVAPQSKALFYFICAAGLLAGIFVSSFVASYRHQATGYTSLLQLLYYVAILVGRFSFRSSMEKHYNGPDPVGLSLSGVMTFFFGAIYFQYHVNDIIRRKHADRIYQMTP